MSKKEVIVKMTKAERDAYANEHNPNNPNYLGRKKQGKQPTKTKESVKINNNRINQEMHELEKLLKYKFKKISLLAEAMNSKRVDNPAKSKEYENERLAIVGDAVLDTVIADMLYLDKNNNKYKETITNNRKSLVKNKVLSAICKAKGFLNYAYNEYHFAKDKNIPKHELVSSKGHDAYVEAIIGAIYYDASYKAAKKWIEDHLLNDMKTISAQNLK